ncbi:hypothetical protein GCM10010124_28300 [Pilimelia terevasa]|uniref:XRE family transcriptional regulator n=1 Tax=Pilimelia terevasa TaxID=53372 RepID=A0A8J3BTN9_9ACTN|nr:helix-turn-helix transcriptional regulator [Pilimelia terevasa]GGK34034.1 hypothetical protein GCM10010124_28300 [Pilimelia terevasa]
MDTGVEPELAALLNRGPFHEALRRAIKTRRLSLQAIQRRLDEAGLHVGLGTLSYWQSGQRRPERPASLKIVAAIERILDLPPRALLGLLGPPKERLSPRRRPAPGKALADLLRAPGPVESLLEALGRREQDLHLLVALDVVTLADNGGIAAMEATNVVEAHRPTDRYILVYFGEPESDAELLSVTALDGCRVGRLRRDAEARLIVAELLFDFELHVGQSHVMRYLLQDASPPPTTEYYRWIRHPAQTVVTQVKFSASRLPAMVWRFTRPYEGAPDQFRQEVPVGPHRSVHLTRSQVEPGLMGIRWVWG